MDAVEAGADAVGLNFYAKSSRYLRPEQREQVAPFCRQLGERAVCVVGVFVNETAERIAQLSAELSLSAIQLHGDEPPEFLTQLPQLPIIRAHRIDHRGLAVVAEDLAVCQRTGRAPAAVLVDAMSAGEYGGTGNTLAWSEIVDHCDHLGNTPLILAGGLTSDNVAEAIDTVRPAGVDTASGVETAPGVKDGEKLKRFVEVAQNAFESF